MNYEETLEYLYTQLPMYQRSGPASYKIDLSNTLALMDILDHPERGFKSVHIAGTNGKGSTAHAIASILQEAGYNVGLYTSPHLKDFRERIRINGTMIPADDVLSFVQENKENWEDIHPSFFELTVGMAFWYFERELVDIAVIEAGLGGRLDSTNVIQPDVSVITNIGLDHQQFLGDTIEKIAAEKAGIIKENTPLVIGEMKAAAEAVILHKTHNKGVDVLYSRDFGPEVPLSDLQGPYQKQNIKTALTAIKALSKKGWEIKPEQVLNGLANVQNNTGLQGRWQVLGNEPLIVADCAHNLDGIRELTSYLRDQDFENLHIVLAVVSDKDVDAILPLFPKDASYYFSEANIKRAMPKEVLTEKAQEFGLKGEAYSSIQKAYAAARIYSQESDLILITGSVFTVSEII